MIPAQSQTYLQASTDQVNLVKDLQAHMYSSKDPKFNMSEIDLGHQNPQRNFSAVLSQKTAASSNHPITWTQGPVLASQYSTAVIGGGGQNIYDRLLNDSTENLLRPTAQMIGSANRMQASNYSSNNWLKP